MGFLTKGETKYLLLPSQIAKLSSDMIFIHSMNDSVIEVILYDFLKMNLAKKK